MSLTPEQIQELLASFYPYRDRFDEHRSIPTVARSREQVLDEVRAMAAEEDRLGDSGRVSGSLYLGDHEQYHFLTQVFEAFAHANVLQRDMYPSATKFEGEIVAMTASMLHGEGAAGVVTSGGTESLMNPLLVYRELGRERGVSRPNIVIPASAHVALDKGGHYFGVDVVRAPLTSDFVVDVDWVRDHITDDTVALVGSAGSYPYGQVDPIGELGALAQERGIGLHVDGCLGGFVLPWIERTGVPVPLWDFRVPGVTSISADTHKFGYALKGTSVLLYRDAELRRRQYSTFPDWPGGLYVSPGMSGSRSGGVIAATWAAMVTTGEQGYLDAASDIHHTALRLREAVGSQPRLSSQGSQTWFHVAFGAADDGLDVFLVNDALVERGWRLNPNQLPSGLHFCVTRPNTAPGIAEAFAADLVEAVAYAEAHAGEPARSGALYGMSGTPAGNAEMGFLLSGALDAMYAVPGPSPAG
ncbi:MAG: aminotransferase class V-fold PLP-dependent enzyme [Actinomycetota bacterium]|nr:aminotransferase class V-fold PLP-dependent enzyme [Actinomycetota bacterium]